ncbi:MAG: ATP-binding protein [Candidatus Brocadiales bacterium]
MYSFLVVSNDNSVHSLLKKSLNRDYVVHTATIPEEALQIFLKEDIDVVFLDIVLGGDGVNTLLEELRQANIDPTIVALVPASQPMLSEEALRLGSYELLETPLRKEAIQYATKRALERQQLKKELGFIQSQINELKPTRKVVGSFEFPSIKQTRTNDLQLTYKEVFQKFSKVLTHVHDLRKLADMTVEAMAEIFRVGRVVFMLIDKEERVVKPYRCVGLDEVAARSICFSTNCGIMLWLTKNHQILNEDVIDREVATNRLTRREAINIQKEINILQAQLCVPIFAEGNLVSVIALGNKITGKAFFDEDIELLSMLAGYMGMAVENALLYKEIYLQKIHNENVLENIPCGVIAINSDCKVNTFNKSAAKMLNIFSHDVIGKDVKHIGSVFADIILRTLKEKKTYKMSEIIHPVTHSTFSVSTSLLLGTGRELGAIMVFSDISEIKKLESRVKDLERREFYNMLSKNMAHYIKNHLVAVKTFIDLFPEKREEKEFAEQFSTIAQEEVSKLDFMVEKLTTLSKNDALIKRTVDLRLPLSQALDSHKDKMKKYNIRLIKKYSEGPTTTYSDCDRLEEAFSNIILNAVEAMPDGGTLTVKLSRTLLDEEKLKEVYSFQNNNSLPSKYSAAEVPKELPLQYIEVLVQDVGSGIPREELRNIFLPFYTTKVHNIGLGLSIAQRIIEEHGGFIYLSTQETRGSNFHILLPSSNLQ